MESGEPEAMEVLLGGGKKTGNFAPAGRRLGSDQNPAVRGWSAAFFLREKWDGRTSQ